MSSPSRNEVRLPVPQAERPDLPMFDMPELPVEFAAAELTALGDNQSYPSPSEPMRVPLAVA